MRKRWNTRVPITLLVAADMGMMAFSYVEGYLLRFHTGLPIPKGVPDLATYLSVTPFLQASSVA